MNWRKAYPQQPYDCVINFPTRYCRSCWTQPVNATFGLESKKLPLLIHTVTWSWSHDCDHMISYKMLWSSYFTRLLSDFFSGIYPVICRYHVRQSEKSLSGTIQETKEEHFACLQVTKLLIYQSQVWTVFINSSWSCLATSSGRVRSLQLQDVSIFNLALLLFSSGSSLEQTCNHLIMDGWNRVVTQYCPSVTLDE